MVKTWQSNVLLRDLESGNQLGECWIVEVEAETPEEAEAAIRNKAWEDVDSRLNDVAIEMVDGPFSVKG